MIALLCLAAANSAFAGTINLFGDSVEYGPGLVAPGVVSLIGDQPPVAYTPGPTVGFGFRGSSYSGGRGGGTAVGSGVGMSIPVGSGDARVAGNAVLYFALDQVGPAPWRLNIKVAETSPAEILLLPR